MTRAIYYPPADRHTQWYGEGNIAMPLIGKLVLHTTEGGNFPDYPSGAGGHPTLTYNPWTHIWHQHVPINGSATALQNAGGFETNRDGVVQV